MPVIALAQLNRAAESSPTKRPQLSHLRESGSIEQDADQVLFIFRPEYYKMDTFEDDTPSAGLADIMFAKNRHGSTGDVRVRFQAQFTKFSDVEDGYAIGTADTFSDEGPAARITPNTNFDTGGATFMTFDAGFNNDNNTPSGPVNSEPNLNDDLPY